jgi:hypothetical protein
MTKYQFSLQIKNSIDRSDYSIDINASQEDNPEAIFTPQVRESIRNQFQADTLCIIKDNQIQKIISRWIEDIREGYRETTLVLDLPLLIDYDLCKIQDSGNQEKPRLVEPELAGIEPTKGVLPPLEIILAN